jgi:hypothetical protein
MIPVHATPRISLRSVLIWSSLLCLGLPSGVFPSGFCNITVYGILLSPVRATRSAHLNLPHSMLVSPRILQFNV